MEKMDDYNVDLVSKKFENEKSDGIKEDFEKYNISCDVRSENIGKVYYNKELTLNNETVVLDSNEDIAEGLLLTLSKNNEKNLLRNYYDKQGVDVEVTDDNEVYLAQYFCS